MVKEGTLRVQANPGSTEDLLILTPEVANRCPLTWENGVAEATVRPSQEDTCSVRSSHSPDQISVTFDDDHAVADAGLILAASLAEGLGLGELFDTHVDLGDAPGAANAGDKAMTLLHSALAGGEWIGDADALPAGVPSSRLVHLEETATSPPT